MVDQYRFVCVTCGTTAVTRRQTVYPPYRCRKGHENEHVLDKKHNERVSKRLEAKP